jgi:hypothetical protein
MELKDRGDIGLMYGANITGIARDSIIVEKDRYIQQLVGQAPFFNEIYIKYFSPGTITVQDLRWWLINLQSIQQVTPGLIIIDYADKFKGVEDDRYNAMGDVYTQLIALGDRFACPIWTGSQINREWSHTDIITEQGIADSWQKIAHADLVLTLSQTKDERKDKKCRLYTAKVRRGEGQEEILCHHRGDLSAIWEMTNEEVTAYNRENGKDEDKEEGQS